MREKFYAAFDASWPAIMVIGAFAAGVIYASIPCTKNWEMGWEMVSGLATTAAAIAALWIAGKEGRRVRQYAKVRAVVLAARIHLPLTIYANNVNNAAEFFSSTTPADVLYVSYRRCFDHITRLRNDKAIEDADLEALVGLGDNTAMLIASAYGHMHTALMLMDHFANDFINAEPINIEQRNIGFPMISLAINDASKQLLLAAQSCQNASMPFTSAHGGLIQGLLPD